MTAYSNWIEFTARDGSLILQRAEDISTVMETTVPVKGGEDRHEVYLILRNNNRVGVVGVTKERVVELIRESTGVIASFIPA